MNKISKILSLVLLSFSLGTLALADVKMGISYGAIDMSPSAKEEKFNAAALDHPADSEDVIVPMGSIFIEKDFGLLSIGVDIVPYDLESEELNNDRNANGRGAADPSEADTTNAKVKVSIETPVMIYALLQNDAGAFVRVGASQANVATEETTPTGSTYPNADIYGGHVSFGVERGFGSNDLAFRIEGGYSGYTNVTVVNDQTARPTKIHVNDMDGFTAKVSILKTF
jgi:hypothetical protein